jgi:hypothetical protein
MSLPWLGFGLGYVFGPPKRRERDQTTADGGKPSAIDYMMDNFGPQPGGPVRDVAAKNAESRRRKMFCVTPETRQGGSGLYDED